METRLKEVLWEGEEIRWSGRPKPFGLLDKALRPSIMLTWISSAVVLLAVTDSALAIRIAGHYMSE